MGTGKIACKTCGGHGVIDPYSKIICKTCEGTGKVICPVCKGGGEIDTRGYW